MNAPELPTAPEQPAVTGPVQRRVSRQPAALPHPYWADGAVTLYHGDALELLAPRRDGWCSHEAVVLDDHTRSVTCANPKCGAALDPFNFLSSNAHTIQRAWSAYKQAMRQANEVAERVSVLKKEEQRLRAMVKRLQEKSGAVLSTRGKQL